MDSDEVQTIDDPDEAAWTAAQRTSASPPLKTLRIVKAYETRRDHTCRTPILYGRDGLDGRQRDLAILKEESRRYPQRATARATHVMRDAP